MRFEIDTENKTIEIQTNCKLNELVDKLKEMLGKEWKNYTLKPKTDYIDTIPWNPPYTQLYPDFTITSNNN